jgi:hypothetical protein
MYGWINGWMKVHGAALSGIYAAEELCGLVTSEECDSSKQDMMGGKDEEESEKEKIEEEEEELPVVVIGAGAAGIFAAATVQSSSSIFGGGSSSSSSSSSSSDDSNSCDSSSGDSDNNNNRVIVLEAKDRHGGRVHTITLPSLSLPPSPSPSLPHTLSPPLHHDQLTTNNNNTTQGMSDTSNHNNHEPPPNMDSVRVDLGASWLQQFPDNFLARRAEAISLDLHPTDFQSSLCAASDGLPLHDLHRVVENLCDVALEQVNKIESIENWNDNGDCSGDMSIIEALHGHISSLPPSEQRLSHLALSGDINSDFGYYLHNTSAKYALQELGVGNGDHYVKQGYAAILDPVARGLDIRYNSPVKSVDWSHKGVVTVTTCSGEEIRASHCICTVPIAVLKSHSLTFIPELPLRHRRAMSNINQGKCEKVVLRYATRWWPHSSNGLYRWYDNAPSGASGDSDIDGDGDGFPMMLDWNEWLDMSDCLGVPVVVGFCVGEEACAKYHGGGQSDAQIAQAAARAFEAWAWHRSKLIEV